MNEKEITRPTVMEVDISNFRYNTEQIRKQLNPNTKLMPVIKANAYGTYLNTRLEVLNEFEIVALATVDEGVQVRNIGYQKEIFILNQPSISEIDKIIENNLVIGLSSNEFLKEVQKRNKVIKVHLEIETGMGRTGIAIQQIDTFLSQIQKTNTIKVEGIYTHLSSPDIDEQYTKEQLETFQKAVEIITKQIKDIKYIHTSASNGIINYPNAQYNLVRPGMILYGYESAEGIGEKISLKPVAKLKSKITFIKTVSEGTSISYARTFKTKKESKIATIPIGYADGLRRSLSNNGYVIINRKKVPIVGKVCMDSFMADVTELENVKVGDDVWIWDNEIITLEEVAKRCDTINYEIISTISVRVPRKFLNK
ncbi:MAG: alanine racemase [Clostridia bacterium]|nr:alanine racemase [Clostridia bacterium]